MPYKYTWQEKILDTSFFMRYDSQGVSKKGGFCVEEIVKQGLLYDFYGELLTEHQRQVYEARVFDNLSLSEIAQDFDISRQGVHDLIKRCDKILQGYEDKLHLLEKFLSIKDTVTQIGNITDQDEVRKLANRILEEL